MSMVRGEVLSTGAAYAGARLFELTPTRHFVVLICTDAGLDPARYAGLSQGDAHVIHNMGRRVDDEAIRSLVIAHKLLGTAEWFVVHQTDCGIDEIDWPTVSEQARNITEDVKRIRAHPLVLKSIRIHGYLYDLANGKLIEIPTATEAGKPRA